MSSAKGDEEKSASFTASREHDVMIGRGRRAEHSAGNVFFRSLIKSRAVAYHTTQSSRMRDSIATEIIGEVEATGGRFLQLPKLNSQHVDKPDQRWVVISKASTRAKVKQALRDAMKPPPPSRKSSADAMHRSWASAPSALETPTFSTPLLPPNSLVGFCHQGGFSGPHHNSMFRPASSTETFERSTNPAGQLMPPSMRNVDQQQVNLSVKGNPICPSSSGSAGSCEISNKRQRAESNMMFSPRNIAPAARYFNVPSVPTQQNAPWFPATEIGRLMMLPTTARTSEDHLHPPPLPPQILSHAAVNYGGVLQVRPRRPASAESAVTEGEEDLSISSLDRIWDELEDNSVEGKRDETG